MTVHDRANRALWNERAAIHARGSSRYPVQRLLDRRPPWWSPLPDDLGSPKGKSLLHLQCHIGMDSLGWAYRGARVTGIDYASEAVAAAQSLSRRSGIPATFIRSDVYTLPRILRRRFDIVATTYGVLCWLPDLDRWARTVRRFVRPRGILYLAEIHPAFDMLEFAGPGGAPLVRNSYFPRGSVRYRTGGSYANPGTRTRQNVHFGWQHSLAEVVNALIHAGFRVEYLHEHPFAYADLTWYTKRFRMRRGRDGFWRLPRQLPPLPITYSVKASPRT